MTCRRFKVGVIVLGAFFILQPGFAAENWPASVNQYVAQVRKAIDTTDLDCHLAVIKNPNGALLLDVREANEFKDGHVPGTVSISSERLEFRIWKLLGYPDKVDMNRRFTCSVRPAVAPRWGPSNSRISDSLTLRPS